MRNFYTFFLLMLALLSTAYLPAQGDYRYIDDIFSDITVDENIVYGKNMTVITLGVEEIEAPTSQLLLCDIYRPEGDDITERPLVILIPTGNFLPIGVNQSTLGNKTDSVNVEIAHRLARKGYVVASIDYRKGWSPDAPLQPDRTLTLIQAAYRGIQDVRTAIRFFRKDYAENANSYGIDTSKITLFGIGTGGYISHGANVLDDIGLIPQTTNPPAKFTIPNPLDPPIPPLIPMVIPVLNGDIYGFGFPNPEDTILVSALTAVPPLEVGDTMNLPNHLGYSSNFHLAVNLNGAMPDISWLGDDENPIISFHVPTDPFAPYNDAVLTVPTTGDPVVQVQGSRPVDSLANALGINAPFARVEEEFAGYDKIIEITNNAKDRSSRADGTAGPHEYFEGLYPFLRPTNEFGQEETSPWNWWDPVVWSAVPALDPRFDNLHDLNLQNNADMSKDKAMAYIDTIMWYFTPRAALALGLTSTEELISPEAVSLQVMPNPASEQVFLRTDAEHPMREVLLFDLNGRLLQAHTRIEASQFEVPRRGIPPGMYVLKISFDEGVTAKRILFR